MARELNDVTRKGGGNEAADWGGSRMLVAVVLCFRHHLHPSSKACRRPFAGCSCAWWLDESDIRALLPPQPPRSVLVVVCRGLLLLFLLVVVARRPRLV